MKKRIGLVLLTAFLLCGCAQGGLVRNGSSSADGASSKEEISFGEEKEASSGDTSASVAAGRADVSSNDGSSEDEAAAGLSSGSDGTESSASRQQGSTSGQEPSTGNKADIYVYISGAVEAPGIYVLKEGDRVYQVVEMAGGLTEGASPDGVNQARILEDGEMVRIPTKEEVAKDPSLSEASSASTGGSAAASSSKDDGKVNINTADEAQLCTLPGIGESKAKAIISYREENGGFSSIEELTNISGIKEGVYSKIKDLICI